MGTIAEAPRPSESGHWYCLRTGNPVYEVVGANGKVRKADLRDARKLLLVPGGTTIIKMKAAPQLVRWLVRQALLAAITLPRNAYESDDAFMARAEEDSKEQARKAAERGTQLHAAIQGSFEGKPVASEDLPYVEPVRAWLAQRYGLEGWEAEQSFASPYGYGSKADISNRRIPAVGDFKCKDFGPEKQAKELAYDEHVMQLASNRIGFLHKYADVRWNAADCFNIFVSTSNPGLIRVREWDELEIEKGWRMFQHCLGLWQEEKNYFPTIKAAA